jgi:ribosomal protein S18 acetylase RimI-like enzyme
MRGQGIGKMLLEYLAKLALKRKCGRLEWWVLDWNKSAIKFYKKLGAKAMSDWTVYRVSGKNLTKLGKIPSPVMPTENRINRAPQ